MDWIFLAICLIFFVRGYFKGFISMIFSLVGTFFIVVLAWKLSGVCSVYAENLFGSGINNLLKKSLDSMIGGSFSTMAELESALGQTNFGTIFGFVISKLLGDISFEGSLTAGQILSPSLSALTIKVITFVVIFLLFSIVLKILKALLNKLVKLFDWNFGNKIFGGLVGLFKGVLIFGIFYVVLSLFANFTFNEGLLLFVKSGQVSNFIYENFIKIIINMFY